MSILVNIENYEAFYLDYLEGNLDEEQTRAFLLFLDQHPELKLEEELPSFRVEESASLDQSFLAGLKVFDATESITEANYEQFMIASVEQQLAATKQVELNDFIARREHLKAEMELYRQTKLLADLSITYPEKSQLKRGGFVIPMYVKFAAAAASIVLILMLIPWNTGSESVLPAQLASLSFDLKVKENQRPGEQEPAKPEVSVTGGTVSSGQGHIQPLYKTEERPEIETIASLQIKKAAHFENRAGKEPLALDVAQIPAQKEENDSYLALSDMKNPVTFITDGIKSRFNRDVDVRVAKASKTRQGGFYLKIGKFEFSRKTGPVNEDVLAVNQ